MTRAMLLCAGMSTRLGALSVELPKPLLPMCDVPIARYGVATLVGHGIRDIVINTHYKAELFAHLLGDGSAFGARIRYVHEPAILGTGGGLKNALDLLDPDGTDEPFVVMNGKLVVDVDVHGLLAAHRQSGGAMATMLVQPVPDAESWGAVDVGDDGMIRDILGDTGGHMFCGVHVAQPSWIRQLPDGEACSIRQGYLPWLKAGRGRVAAFGHRGYFAEHSTPERYLEGNVALLSGASLRHRPAPATGVDDTAVIHDSAQIVEPVRIAAAARIDSGATVGPHAVVGAGATVAAGASVTRSVVWAGAKVPDAVTDAIVTPRGVSRIAPP